MGLPSAISPSIGFSLIRVLPLFLALFFRRSVRELEREETSTRRSRLGVRLISAPQTAKSLVARMRGCQWAAGGANVFWVRNGDAKGLGACASLNDGTGHRGVVAVCVQRVTVAQRPLMLGDILRCRDLGRNVVFCLFRLFLFRFGW